MPSLQSRGRQEGRSSGANEASLARARMAKEHRELQEAIRQSQRALGMYYLFEDLIQDFGPAAATSAHPLPPSAMVTPPPRKANMLPPHESCLQENRETVADFLRIVSTTQPLWQESLSQQLGDDFHCASHERREEASSITGGSGRMDAAPPRSWFTEPLLTMPEYGNEEVHYDQSEFFTGRRLPTEQAFFKG